MPSTSWAIESTGDPAALAITSGNRRLLLVAGRQVVAREGLEVLLLGTTARVPDGQPIRDVLAQGAGLGALRVIPWGAGKWWFGRGRLLRDLMTAVVPGDGFFLGDGGGRPFFWSTPSHFRDAERRGIAILPGTDPLPFPHQTGRAGSYGFRLEGALELASPGEGIKAALRQPSPGSRPSAGASGWPPSSAIRSPCSGGSAGGRGRETGPRRARPLSVRPGRGRRRHLRDLRRLRGRPARPHRLPGRAVGLPLGHVLEQSQDGPRRAPLPPAR